MIGVLDFKEFLDNNIPFTYAKFGDGELICMSGQRGQNCDRHPYSTQLGDKLKKSLFELTSRDNVYIADWTAGNCPNIRDDFTNLEKFNKDNLADYGMLLSLDSTLKDPLREFYRSIKKCDEWKQVMLVIPERLNGISQYIAPNATIINVPLINAFSKYDEILSTIRDQLEEDAIMISACGMNSKALIGELIAEYEGVTFLDFGSAFDPLLVGNTRTGQSKNATVQEFFDSI